MDNNIKMCNTYNEAKSSMIERFNRMLNETLRPYFEMHDNHEWVKLI